MSEINSTINFGVPVGAGLHLNEPCSVSTSLR